MAYAIGMMSGTSLDGIDVALVDLSGCDENTTCELIHYKSYPYDSVTQQEILAASHIETSNVALICSLNFKLGKLYSEAVTQFLKEFNVQSPLEFIAIHGQTIHHLPNPTNGLTHSTLQIGDPAQLAFDHKTIVVSNFRPMDMIAGGNGAPLVPYTEYLLFRDSQKNRVLQNIGGIGNVTVLPKNCTEDEIFAFDTGPGNMMINAAMQYFFQKDYDDRGNVAKQGKIIPELLKNLQSHPYFDKLPPKATGRELFGEDVVNKICVHYHQFPNDVIHTLTELTAWSIADSYQKFIMPKLVIDEVIIGGGGAYNQFLMDRLSYNLPNITVKRQEDIGLSSDAKEAIAFAILGNQTIHSRPSNLMSATGAKIPVILGNITPNPWNFK
ncbi:anhydro-N-acetylmuramic acid kinase AnmK [Wohlfahrtiimonas larvae]|uniref:Anhydro-N-acetylmuramic acid kinase n=1 Tax=Wohlfahrtiimonas larvae TaxID=1157986 RepID=A0ABP9MI94_9GAMM|nr:anhydro-N-acetylmuramic acid kinase AnmK [Wohlfahrtiimonas larvae]